MSLYMEDNFDSTIKYDIAIILGCNNYNIMKERLDETIKLINKNIIDKVIASGGNSYIDVIRKDKEALIMKEYLVNNNINEDKIIIEDKSKNTYQNIYNSYNIIKKEFKSYPKILLITSDFHIKRSIYLYEKITRHTCYYKGLKSNYVSYKTKCIEFLLLKYYLLKK